MTAPTIDRVAFDCPAWCTANHENPMMQREELEDGIREHGFCVGQVAEASVWVNRSDVLTGVRPGRVTVWAESEGPLNTEESIKYAQLIAAATAIAEEAQP
uniref:hypothetical protein n=1 Tax=Paractinoplanes polyasparticus TaxID=2856853 RepID=UPI001C8569C0|nr:hypothetical protein [Actinoplanes polyasparticus]